MGLLTCLQTDSAVALLSPVTTMTRMPAARQVAIAAATSGRGGSCMPTTPSSVSSCSSAACTCTSQAATFVTLGLHRMPQVHPDPVLPEASAPAHRPPAPVRHSRPHVNPAEPSIECTPTISTLPSSVSSSPSYRSFAEGQSQVMNKNLCIKEGMLISLKGTLGDILLREKEAFQSTAGKQAFAG